MNDLTSKYQLLTVEPRKTVCKLCSLKKDTTPNCLMKDKFTERYGKAYSP